MDFLSPLVVGVDCGVCVLQIDLGDLQIHADMEDGFVFGVNHPLRLVLVAKAKALALVEMRVKTIIGVADAAINQTIAFHISKRNRA